MTAPDIGQMETNPLTMDKTVRRRLAKKAKKEKLRKEMEVKKQSRLMKKEKIVSKIREKRAAERETKKARKYGYAGADEDMSGQKCWLCGGTDHQKTECPNKHLAHLSKTCFNCRRRGHSINDCPAIVQNSATSNICFNCGSEKHRLRDCKKAMVNGGTSFASCFLCNEKGHLSSKCPSSQRGIYPKGGSCKLCGSVMHLARDCTENNSASAVENVKEEDVYSNDDGDTIKQIDDHGSENVKRVATKKKG